MTTAVERVVNPQAKKQTNQICFIYFPDMYPKQWHHSDSDFGPTLPYYSENRKRARDCASPYYTEDRKRARVTDSPIIPEELITLSYDLLSQVQRHEQENDISSK